MDDLIKIQFRSISIQAIGRHSVNIMHMCVVIIYGHREERGLKLLLKNPPPPLIIERIQKSKDRRLKKAYSLFIFHVPMSFFWSSTFHIPGLALSSWTLTMYGCYANKTNCSSFDKGRNRFKSWHTLQSHFA